MSDLSAAAAGGMRLPGTMVPPDIRHPIDPMPPAPPFPFPRGDGLHIGRESNRLVEKYDRDGDGAVSVGRESTRLGRSENGALEFSSIEQLARVADALGNGDGKATAKEMARVMREFDTGTQPGEFGIARANDGVLQGSERKRYEAGFGEQTKGVGLPEPIPNPVPPFIMDGKSPLPGAGGGWTA